VTVGVSIRQMPAQKPHRSVQEVATPRAFLDAVEAKFGALSWDLAANAENSVCGQWFYGPGSKHAEDSLSAPWNHEGVAWLNPPYSDITSWAKKCSAESRNGARILLLVPASVGSEWFAHYVWPRAMTYALRPRLTFVGHTAPYPKDLILCHYAPDVTPGFELWRWRP
jgi:phage N-6-adenine-methyltransferase